MAEKDPVVYALNKASRCYHCDARLEKDALARLQEGKDEQEVLCGKCAELDGLELLPGGNAQLTRLAKKYSKTRFVVVKWSELWKCYERQGLLLEPQAIERARKEASG